MRGDYGIEYFHSACTWEQYGAYQRMTQEAATEQAQEFAKNLYANPFGVRVTGPKGWKSERIGGRDEITPTFDPVSEVWTVRCSECKSTEEHTDVYEVTKFARHHEC